MTALEVNLNLRQEWHKGAHWDIFFLQFPKPNEVSNVLYKYSEYTITEPPRRKRRKTLFQKLNKNILQHRNQALILNKVIPIDKWKPPHHQFIQDNKCIVLRNIHNNCEQTNK